MSLKEKKGICSSSTGKSLFHVNASSSIFIALKRLGGVCCWLCIFLKRKANYFKEWVSIGQENLSYQILHLQGSQRKHRGILERWVWRIALMFSFFLAFCQILLSIFSESSIALFIISFMTLMFASSVWFGTYKSRWSFRPLSAAYTSSHSYPFKRGQKGISLYVQSIVFELETAASSGSPRRGLK